MIQRLLSVLITVMLLCSCTNNEKRAIPREDSSSRSDSIPVNKKTIVFFGNSLTAGYGLSPAEAFPALIQKKIDSLGLPYTVVNAGVSGETSSGGNSRIDWVLRQPMDVFVLELGANDGLRGIPVSETRKNLQSIINKVKAAKPSVKLILAGMQVPPNMGEKYAAEFRSLYPQLAAANKMTLIPFILEGVGGEVTLNQADGIHPTAAGHQVIADHIWSEIHDVLQSSAAL